MSRLPHQFQPGQPRPKGAGMQPGQKTKKVLAREQAAEASKESLRQLFKQTKGMSIEEVFDFMDYDPLVHMISIATDPHVPPAVAQKAVDTILKKTLPDLKSVETKGETVTAIKVIMPGMVGYDDHGATIEQISAGQIEQSMQLSQLTEGLDYGEDDSLDDDRDG